MGRPYEVGYAKPPLSSRFKPGQSGNKRGRPKKRPSLIEHFDSELKRRHVVHENGEARSLTMMQILVKQLIAQAAKGQAKPLMVLLDIVQQLDSSSKKGEETGAVLALTKEDIEKMTEQELTQAYRRLIDLSRNE